MALAPSEFEKLGIFYLGRLYDLPAKQPIQAPLLYDSRDLTTHAMCVGMTGSGKTGLCVALIEEAAIDGIPAVIIDPKGDLANLMLSFPNLSPQDFQPWVNPEDAARKGVRIEDLAADEAAKWKAGLASWGQDGSRIQRLRDASEITIYTPASTAGVAVSIAGSFDAPDSGILGDPELLGERVQTTVSSLLGLLGIDAVQSREATLLGAILAEAWKAGDNLDFAAILQRIQKPSFSRVGMLDLEAFYPAKDRFEFVLALNNLLASPGFSAWMQGVPLDIGSMLYTPKGTPRLAIFSIAHLGDAERMFFVSMLLNQMLGWMRTQSGTTSLRALLYMDEVFGFFPPVASPPSKKPLMTLLKQARAFGLGVVLATQNPADLDYKGLANIGTWFIGRLQTERDKARLLEGLEGTGGGFDRPAMERTLSSLGNRIFLMRNIHDDEPVLFESRWSLSYLRGPLTREQIRCLMAGVNRPAAAPTPAPAAESAGGAALASTPPHLSPSVPQVFVSVAAASDALRAALIGVATISYSDSKLSLDEHAERIFAVPLEDRAIAVDWDTAQPLEIAVGQIMKTAPDGAKYAPLPNVAAQAKSYPGWQRDFARWILSSQKIRLLRSPATKLVSHPGEPESGFRLRVQQLLREQRDDAVARLREKYQAKLSALGERIARAEAAVERERSEASEARLQTVMSLGSSILGAFLGRKLMSTTSVSRAASVMKGVGRTMRQGDDVSRAKESVETFRSQQATLEAELSEEIAKLEARLGEVTEPLETIEIAPKKTGISIRLFALGWVPEDLLAQK